MKSYYSSGLDLNDTLAFFDPYLYFVTFSASSLEASLKSSFHTSIMYIGNIPMSCLLPHMYGQVIVMSLL